MNADELTEKLIERCRLGEGTAREQLFQRYRHYLRVLAEAQLGRYLRTRCDPSDLVQQTLLEAHRDFGRFTGQYETELLAWLRRILAHNLFNEARTQGAKQRDAAREISLDQLMVGVEHSSMALGQCLAAGTPTPSSNAMRHESAVNLADALSHLPDDYQTVLILRIFEGLSADEVARHMDRTPGAIRMLQLRALTALREHVQPNSGYSGR